MPEETSATNPYGYARETDTVRVGQYDPARLPLLVRTLMREQRPGRWKHMHDFDLSFERLADAVDAAGEARQGNRWTGPDLRMSCTTTEAAYTWPDGAPYDGGTLATWKVPGYQSHAAAEGPRGRDRSLCGFGWAQWEGRAVGAWRSAWSVCVRSGSVPHTPVAAGDYRRGYGRDHDAEYYDPGSCDAGVVALSPGWLPESGDGEDGQPVQGPVHPVGEGQLADGCVKGGEHA